MENLIDKGSLEALSILDSKHILATKFLYNVKIVKCGNYSQVYLYKEKKLKKKEEKSKDLDLKKLNNTSIINQEQQIEQRSIIRSKLQCQRIAKANIEEWKTFITLTFADNISDIKQANKRLKYFCDKVRRIKKDFKYLGIPEFQKRGATHYHLLTNIDINDPTLMFTQEDNSKYKHIKYWNDGFTSIEPIKGDVKKIVGYISKYMTKDIDNRLFNSHRYFYSRNLTMPKEEYLNLDDERNLEYYKKNILEKELIYHNQYLNPYDNNEVTFLEYL